MTEAALAEIKSAFSSLIIVVRSALEKKRVKVKDVRQFLATLRETVTFPNVPI